MPDPEKDLTLTCKDCGAKFAFTEKDQEFFKEKGYEPPKRCKPCRAAKKQASRSQGS